MLLVVASLAITLAVARMAPKPQRPADDQRSAEETTTIDWSRCRGDRVLVLGHDFARDWVRYWGAVPRQPVSRAGLTLVLGDLDTPPGGTDAARDYVEGAPRSVIAFCMLGPESLSGGTARDADASVADALAEVDAIAGLAKKRGLRLVVGGPLPSLPADTDRYLVRAQDAYASALRERERAGKLAVFDAFEHMSTAGQVTLARGYALTQADSRLGPPGYEALDDVFFPFMRGRFGGGAHGK